MERFHLWLLAAAGAAQPVTEAGPAGPQGLPSAEAWLQQPAYAAGAISGHPAGSSTASLQQQHQRHWWASQHLPAERLASAHSCKLSGAAATLTTSLPHKFSCMAELITTPALQAGPAALLFFAALHHSVAYLSGAILDCCCCRRRRGIGRPAHPGAQAAWLHRR